MADGMMIITFMHVYQGDTRGKPIRNYHYEDWVSYYGLWKYMEIA